MSDRSSQDPFRDKAYQTRTWEGMVKQDPADSSGCARCARLIKRKGVQHPHVQHHLQRCERCRARYAH